MMKTIIIIIAHDLYIPVSNDSSHLFDLWVLTIYFEGAVMRGATLVTEL